MKFIHIADLHANKQRLEPCMQVLESIKNYIIEHSNSKEDAPPLLIAGDFWDNTITNTENSGFSTYVEAMDSIIKRTEVYMIYGTPFHEPRGSLEIFRKMGAYIFSAPGTFTYKDKYSVYAMPEPRKSNYPALPHQELTKAILDDLRTNLDKFKIFKDSSKVPVNVMMYHGEIKGCTYQNGMRVADSSYAIPKNWLADLNMDYIACGHIHMPQEVEGVPNCYYSGSCYPVNYGEGHIAGMNIVEISEE